VSKLLAKTLDCIFPPKCVICGKYIEKKDEFESLCNSCFYSIETYSGFSCPQCEKRIPDIKNICHRKNYLLISACNYKDKKIEKMIQSFKYDRIISLSKPLTRLVISSLSTVITSLPFYIETSFLVPIPISKSRLRERGFNQTELIVKELITYIPELEINTTILKRKKSLSAQAKTHSREERKNRMHNSFEADKKNGKENIILVDDIFTTGATIEDAIRALKEVGYKRIVVLTIARTSKLIS
jgi:ComF family protein